MVTDRAEHLVVPDITFQFDDRAVPAEFYRIVNQVVENLLDFLLIRQNGKPFSGQCDLEGNLPWRADSLKRSSCISYHFIEIKNADVKQIFFLVHAVQCQDAVCKLCQAFGLIQNDAQIALLHLCGYGAIQNRLDESLDRSKRRTKIVGYIRNELFLIFIAFADFIGHHIQRCRKMAHFIL